MDLTTYQIKAYRHLAVLICDVIVCVLELINMLLFALSVKLLTMLPRAEENGDIDVTHVADHDSEDLLCNDDDELPLHIRELLDTVTEPLPVSDLP